MIPNEESQMEEEEVVEAVPTFVKDKEGNSACCTTRNESFCCFSHLPLCMRMSTKYEPVMPWIA